MDNAEGRKKAGIFSGRKPNLAPTGGIGLYIHAPFCAKRCSYCDFYSTTDVRVERVGRYVEAVQRELREWSMCCTAATISTIYFGGGTPSLLGHHITRILETIGACFTVQADAEITVEANPGSLDHDILMQWVASGVNRISLGVQSFDKEVLKVLGRGHSIDDTMKALSLLDETGVEVSIDLMCSVPCQDTSAWRAQLEMAIACEVGHISVYPLTLEKNTLLARQVAAGQITLPDDEEGADQMMLAHELLGEAGFEHYEVSNYARPYKRARHNMGYWTGVPYLGIGPSAASMVPLDDGTRLRAIAHTTLDHFIRASDQKQKADRPQDNSVLSLSALEWWSQGAREILDVEDAIREDIMLTMRTKDGVESLHVEEAGLFEVFETLCAQGLVFFDDRAGRYRPTARGYLLGNEIYSAIWNRPR